MRTRPTRSVLLGIGFVAVVTAAQLLRQSGLHVWDTVWAEDGRIYTTDALNHPATATLFRGYAGYVQLLPRLLALGTRLVPPDRIAEYLALASAVVTSLLGLVVVRSSAGWIRSELLRWTLGLMTALAPVAYFEVNANLANLGWPLVMAAFWAIASRQRGRLDVAVRVLVVVLAALTTGVALILVPWAVVVAGLRRRRPDYVVGAAFVAASLAQLAADVASGQPPRPPGWSSGYVGRAFGARVLGSLVTGERWLGTLWLYHPQLLIGGSAAVVVGLGGLALWWRDPTVDQAAEPAEPGPSPSSGAAPAPSPSLATDTPAPVPAPAAHRAWAWAGRLRLTRNWLAAAALALSLVSYLATVWERGYLTIGLTSAGAFNPGGSRYAYLPVLGLFTALAVLVDGTGRAWLRNLFLAWTAFVLISSLSLPTLRSHGPNWSTGVAAATARCRAHPAQASTQVPVAPGGTAWTVTISCALLR